MARARLGFIFCASKYNAQRFATHLRLSSENCSFGLPAHQAAQVDMTAVNLEGRIDLKRSAQSATAAAAPAVGECRAAT